MTLSEINSKAEKVDKANASEVLIRYTDTMGAVQTVPVSRVLAETDLTESGDVKIILAA